MNLKTALIFSAALGCGLASGFVWRQAFGSRNLRSNQAGQSIGQARWLGGSEDGQIPTQATSKEAADFTTPAALPAWRPELSGPENELAMYEALESASAAQLEDWLNTDYRISTDSYVSSKGRAWAAAQQAMMDRLLEKSPAGFARWLGRVPSGQLRDSWITDALKAARSAGGQEQEQVFAALKTGFPRECEIEKLTQLSESDPAAALKEWKGRNSYDLPDACADFLAADPDKALAFVSEKPGALLAVCQAFRRLGPEALERFAETLPASAENAGAAWSLVASDKAKALQPGDGAELAALLKEHRLMGYPINVFTELPADMTGEVLTSLNGQPKLQSCLLATLASSDPAAAAKLFAESPEAVGSAILKSPQDNYSVTTPFLQQLAKSWSLPDSKALRDWAQSLPATLRSAVLPDVAAVLSGKTFMDFTRGSSPGDSDQALFSIGYKAAKEAADTASLIDWLDSFPSATREKLSANMMQVLAPRDPATATALAVSQLDFQKREEMIRAVGRTAVFENPAMALQWGADLPADLRVSGLTEAFRQLGNSVSGIPAAEFSESVTTLINSQPPESQAAWKDLAWGTVQRTSAESLATAEAFWTSLPESVREVSWEAFGYVIGENLNPGSDSSKLIAQLGEIKDAGLRRKIAGQLAEAVPGLPQFTKDQAASLTAQLRDIGRK